MAATWRVARSLDRLLAQLNALAPRRSKASDGSIGDAAHASRSSDHNPWVRLLGLGIVTARDFTHDPAGGLDCEQLYAALVRSRDPRIKYVIWRRTITSGAAGPSPWVRRTYTGSNPHDKHLHLSVEDEANRYDDARDWLIPGAPVVVVKPAPAPSSAVRPVLRRGDTGGAVVELQRRLVALFPAYRHEHGELVADGAFGPTTEAWVRELQERSGLTADGVVGPRTYAALGWS